MAPLAHVVRTCIAVPSQWNAWTVDGQYLYMRYRSGIGTVDAYDDADHEKWTRIPDGAVARFDTGDRLDGEMSLAEFCQRTIQSSCSTAHPNVRYLMEARWWTPHWLLLWAARQHFQHSYSSRVSSMYLARMQPEPVAVDGTQRWVLHWCPTAR